MNKYLKKLLIIFVLFIPISLYAMFIPPIAVPVDRLVANMTAYLKENSASIEGYYTLGRIHYLAFASKSVEVFVMNETEMPYKMPKRFGGYDYEKENLKYNAKLEWARLAHAQELALKELGVSSVDHNDKELFDKYTGLVNKFQKELEDKNLEPDWKNNFSALLKHVKESQLNFTKAILLDPNKDLYHLSLASLYLQYLEFKKDKKFENEPEELKEIDLNKTRELFYKAYSISITKSVVLKNKPVDGIESLISYEAGMAFLKLSKTLTNLSDEEKKRIEDVSNNIKILKLVLL